MGQLDADAFEREGWSLCRTFQKDKDTMVYEVKKPSDFPTIEERKTGKWIEITPEEGHDIYTVKCDQCGVYEFFETNYCHHCGAKMEGKA